MKKKKKLKDELKIFSSIRKPTAPPTKKMGEDKPAEKIHPSQRKSKHKQKIVIDE